MLEARDDRQSVPQCRLVTAPIGVADGVVCEQHPWDASRARELFVAASRWSFADRTLVPPHV
ncbi:MAG: hypothetical protein DCF16_08600 [Alphaproteobacteria bacterium]|nr:MAG: hypothetical protein DCF16_08600 [Alphaproteobacteria bacterium]